MSERAPWTEDQVAKLNEWQDCDWVHPFTCASGNRRDFDHEAYQREHGGDFGQLVATVEGWRCPACSYTQDWAHDFMLMGAPPDPLNAMRKARP